MRKLLLTSDPAGGNGVPAKPAPETKPEPPAATSIVLDGKKSEREILLEKENGKLLDDVTKLKLREKQLETDNAHLADKVSKLNHIPAAKPKPAPAGSAPAPVKTKGGYTFFG